MERVLVTLARKPPALAAGCLAALLAAVAAPASGDVRLGDETVPRERFIVYLFIGHSNMDGRARKRINPPHERAWWYDGRGQNWVPAAADGSPVMPFLRAMCERHGEYHFGAIKMSVSAARIHQRYRKGCGHYDALVAVAQREKPRCTLGGVLAMIGFAEAGNQQEATGFLDQARGMMQEMREDLREPTLPLLIGKYEEGARDNRGFKHVVQEAIYRIPKEIEHAAVIDTDGPYIDGHHYTAEGQKAWAEEGARLIDEKRLFPFAPPVRVRLTAPAEGQVFDAGDVKLTVQATSEEGKIAAVTFFADGKKLGADNAAPFELAWNAPAQGIHHLKAAAKDGRGNTAESVAVTMAVGDVPSVLLVPGSTNLCSTEMLIKRRLERLGYLVHTVSDDDVTTESANGRSAVLIPASCHGLAVRKFRLSPAPVVIWNDFCPELRIVPRRGGAIVSGVDTLAIPDGSHPLSAGLAGPVQVFDQPQRVRWVHPGDGVHVAATLDGHDDRAALFAYDAGDPLPHIGRAAPNRRVSLFLGHFAATHFTDAGWKLFDAAVRWAVEGEPLADAGEAPPPPYDEWPANRDRLAFLWDSVRATNRVEKLTGKGTRVCEATPHGTATYDRLFRMDTRGGSFRAPQMDAALAAACRESRQFSVELTVTPAGGHQKWSRIFSYDAGNAACNVVLGQEGEWLFFRLRTSRTDKHGASGGLCRIDVAKTSHVVLTCGQGAVRAYIDGEPSGTVFEYHGDLSTWAPQQVVFGDSSAGGHNWNGRIEGVCLYARALRAGEIRQRWALFRPRLKADDRKPPPRVVIAGKLLKTSAPAEPAELYRRSLVVYEYEVQQVLEGELDARRILVAHWATLDGRPVLRTRGLRTRGNYRLTIEPFDAHPELAGEERNDETGGLDLPVFYDVDR